MLYKLWILIISIKEQKMTKISLISIVITLLVLIGCSEDKPTINETESSTKSDLIKKSSSPVMNEQQLTYQEGVDYRLVNNINTGDLTAPFII